MLIGITLVWLMFRDNSYIDVFLSNTDGAGVNDLSIHDNVAKLYWFGSQFLSQLEKM